MNNVKLLIAGSAFFAMSAQAADRVSIDVKVTLEAAACTPILSNGGVVNFGSHSVNRLSTQHYTQWICPYISRHLLSLNPLL
ncbi:TPA: DUF1120 domain-containing protein, partial [Escherichia coli]